jgi:ribosome-binding protein aMBF1 (putative translation factor)
MQAHTKKHLTESDELASVVFHIPNKGDSSITLTQADARHLLDLAQRMVSEGEGKVPWRETAKAHLQQGDVALVVRAARKRAELTQQQLADKLGVPQSNVAAIETGKRDVGKDLAKRLAEIFETDYRMFL